MLSLAFSEKSLEVQRNVVIEEFKQRYLNQPYGDVWLKLKPLAYQVHPYQWATIGKEISHIENAKIADVKAFFAKHYNPSNAVLVVAGAVTLAEVKSLCDKWFSPIPAGIKYERNLPDEPIQLAERSLKVYAKVPTDAIYKAFHIDSRLSGLYNTADLISDILSRGESSRLYQSLVKNKRIFSEINAYISGDIEPGLLIVEGKLMPGITMEQADESIWIALDEMKTDTVPVREMQKNINKLVSAFVFGEMSLLNKAMNLAYYELLGDANLINVELEQYQQITVEAIQAYAKQIFRKENCATLYYHSQN
jgi:predicted Zn-dependent peptidase